MIEQFNMHKCTHNSPLYYILFCLIEQFDKTDDYQTLRDRIQGLKTGILDYDGKDSVVKILSNTTSDNKTRQVLKDFYQKETDHLKTMLFFSVVQAIATWKPKDPDQDINLVFKEKWKHRKIQNNVSYYSMDESFRKPEDFLDFEDSDSDSDYLFKRRNKHY